MLYNSTIRETFNRQIFLNIYLTDNIHSTADPISNISHPPTFREIMMTGLVWTPTWQYVPYSTSFIEDNRSQRSDK